MIEVSPGQPPPGALIERYRDLGDYVDCFVATLPGHVSHARYVEAFYTSPLFRLERWFLTLVLWKPSTDRQAAELARGDRDAFAAWTVEARAVDQTLVCDYLNVTRSWLQSVQTGEGEIAATTLYFGTVVSPTRALWLFHIGFRVLNGYHGGYARALLRSAARRLALSPGALSPGALGA